jgi:hypothetical protein
MATEVEKTTVATAMRSFDVCDMSVLPRNDNSPVRKPLKHNGYPKRIEHPRGVRGAGCGVWDVGCGVWGVGCGVWGVGCGV